MKKNKKKVEKESTTEKGLNYNYQLVKIETNKFKFLNSVYCCLIKRYMNFSKNKLFDIHKLMEKRYDVKVVMR